MNHLEAADYIVIVALLLIGGGVKLTFHIKCRSLAKRGDRDGLLKILRIRLVFVLMFLLLISPLLFKILGHWIWLIFILGFGSACLTASGWLVDKYMNIFDSDNREQQE